MIIRAHHLHPWLNKPPELRSFRMRDSAEFILDLFFLLPQVILILNPQPEIRRVPEISSQAQSRVCGNFSSALDYFGHPGCGHTGIFRQSVCGYIHRQKELFMQYFSGSNIRYTWLTIFHGNN